MAPAGGMPASRCRRDMSDLIIIPLDLIIVFFAANLPCRLSVHGGEGAGGHAESPVLAPDLADVDEQKRERSLTQPSEAEALSSSPAAICRFA